MTLPPPPKVLRVIARLNVGGPARQALLLHETLRARGFQSMLVHGRVGPGEASLEHLLEERGLDSVRVQDLGAAVKPFSDVRAFLCLLRLLFVERPDIVHTHTAKAGALGRLAALVFNLTRTRSRRCLVVHTFHGNVMQGYFGPVGTMMVRCAERLLARITDRIVTISPRQRAEIVETFRIAPTARVSVLRLGLDLDRFLRVGRVDDGLREELGLPEQSVLFGCIGRLVPIKDLPTLLHAFAIASERVPRICLLIVGDGGEREPLERLAATLGLGQAVRFLGWRHDLERLYGGLDVVVLSSRNEGTPVALIEAMASRRPVIATAVGGVPDLVQDGDSGVLVPPRDPGQLAGAIARLALSRELREAMGAAGRSRIEPYTKEHLLEAVSGLYRQGLSDRRGQPTSRREPADVEPTA